MSTDEQLGPLPASLAGLVDAERRAVDAPLPQRDRVWSALAAKLPGPGGGGGPSDPNEGGSTNGSPHTDGAAPGGSPANPAGAGVSKAGLAKLAAVLGIGAVVSIALVSSPNERSARPDASAVVALDSPNDAGAAPAVERSNAAPRDLVTPVRAPSDVTTPAPVAPERSDVTVPAPRVQPTAVAREAEDSLIEQARVALARARFDEALGLLTRHEQRFPHGSRSSERELLFVRALLGTSDRATAVQRAERLRRANSRDPNLPAIDALLRK